MIIIKRLFPKWLIPVLSLLAFTAFQTNLCAQKVTEINSERFNITVNGEYRHFFEDVGGGLTIDEVWGVDSIFDQGASGPKDINGIYWVRAKLFNTTPYHLEVVATEPRTIHSALYKKEGNSWFSSNFGSFVRKSNLKPEDGRQHVTFRLKPGVEETIYFRGQGRAFRVRLMDAGSFNQKRKNNHVLDAWLFGACFILVFYALVQWFVYRKRMFLYLMIFALGTAMYSFAIRGYFIDWFMPDQPKLGLNFSLVWAQFGHLGGLLLTINFLELKRRFPFWYKVFLVLIALLVFRTTYGFYLTAVHNDYGAMTNMSLYTLVVDIVIFLALLFVLWKRVNVSRRVFLLGLVSFGLALIMVIIIWKLNYIQDFRLALLYTGSTTSLIQVIMFSIALGIQMRQHEVDKNVALDELNTVLKEQNRKIEQQVLDRTAEINAQRLQLEERNDRIETLFREVHHRVKNNLQLISSLLNMQQEWSSTEDPAKAIEDSRSRVVAMSMIHQFLYRTEDISTIDFKQYAQELANQLNEIQIESVSYNFNTSFDEDYVFDLDTSISLGLILNELITNSYKYALTDDRALVIGLQLINKRDGTFEMIYSDNGPSINAPFEQVVKKGFGLRLASRLARQLQGRFEYKWLDKNYFTVTFASRALRMELADG